MAAYIEYSKENGALLLRQDWNTRNIAAIQKEYRKLKTGGDKPQKIDASGIGRLDTAGAWLLSDIAKNSGGEVSGLDDSRKLLFGIIQKATAAPPAEEKKPGRLYRFFNTVGTASFNGGRDIVTLVSFIGEVAVATARCVIDPRRMRYDSITRHIRESGIDAMPIVSLMAFLMSIVLAYQGASQLRQFGAEIFTINMVAVSFMREMGVLLTAIMVAGRSGSAFTAEIGVMKINEEVDAMQTMRLDPFAFLVVPRFLGLLIALPALTILADIMGGIGGGIMCNILLKISPSQYLDHFRGALHMSDFWIGIAKAPVFALLIAVVGCLRGMQVTGSAESLGRLTTLSVVHSIFLVLLADAGFSILFTKFGL